MNEVRLEETKKSDSGRERLKEAVTFIFLFLVPLIGITLVFPLNGLFGLTGQAVGVGVVLGSLVAGALLLLAAGRGRLTRIILALLAFGLFLGGFYVIKATSFFAKEAMNAIVLTMQPFLVLSVSRTLFRAFFPDQHEPADQTPSSTEEKAEG